MGKLNFRLAMNRILKAIPFRKLVEKSSLKLA